MITAAAVERLRCADENFIQTPRRPARGPAFPGRIPHLAKCPARIQSIPEPYLRRSPIGTPPSQATRDVRASCHRCGASVHLAPKPIESPSQPVHLHGHNEFLERHTYGDLLDQPELLKDLSAGAHRLRTAAVLGRIADLIPGRGDRGRKPIVLGNDVKRIPIDAVGPEAYTRDEALREQIITHIRLSLNRMLDVAESCGAKVLLVSPASDCRHAAPFKSEHSEGLPPETLARWEAAYAGAAEHLGNGESEAALADLETCTAIDPMHAYTYFRCGGVLHDLGETYLKMARFDKAVSAYRRLLSLDPQSRRIFRASLRPEK